MTMKRFVVLPAFAYGGFALLVLQVLFNVGSITVDAVTVDGKIREDPDLSEFYGLLETSDSANSTLMHRHATVFAPTNRAFQNFKHNVEELRDLLVLYHLSNLPQTIDQLGDTVTSELEGNPPLWVTRKRENSHEEVYINNAKIIEGSTFKAVMRLQSKYAIEKTQVMHKIDEVLEPVITRKTAPSPVYNPNAFALMNQSDNIDLGKDPAQSNITLNLRTFRQQVSRHHKDDVFKAEGRFTFFMPADHGFQPDSRPQKVDAHVIDGHVVPGHVLFTTPTPKNKPYNTLAFTDNIKVTISFVIRNDKMYVESNTLAGPPEYTTGVVPAEIIKANIPVRNGVVHLISRPLMVVDTTVRQFIEEKQDGPVYMFYDKIKNYGGNFMETLNSYQGAKGITLFAPSNAAWEAEGVSAILQDQEKFREILNLHFVKQKLPLDQIKVKSINQVKTAAEWNSLYFNVISGPNGSQTVTVEGGGANATIITADIAATNGIIHIIDRVLGVPYTTILDKLRTDPMLNVTYTLGAQRNFNDQLNDTRKRFTYFVPRNSAWESARRLKPSTYTKLFMPRYNYHTKSILERHLLVANEGYTMSKLKAMSVNGTLSIPAQRDVLKIRIREHENSEKYDENEIRPGDNYGYQIEWNGEWIRVFRPDVPCTNGIIHVIDAVLVSPGDVQVPGPGFDTDGASMISLAPHLLMIVLAKWFL